MRPTATLRWWKAFHLFPYFQEQLASLSCVERLWREHSCFFTLGSPWRNTSSVWTSCFWWCPLVVMPISAFLTTWDDRQEDGAEDGLRGKRHVLIWDVKWERKPFSFLVWNGKIPSQAVTPTGLFRKKEVATANWREGEKNEKIKDSRNKLQQGGMWNRAGTIQGLFPWSWDSRGFQKPLMNWEVWDNQGLLTASPLPVSPKRPSQAEGISPIFPGAPKIQLLQTDLGWAMWRDEMTSLSSPGPEISHHKAAFPEHFPQPHQLVERKLSQPERTN